MIVIIDYDAGNICSVSNALNRLGVDFVLSDDKEVIKSAEKVIFPGVGHAFAAMEKLRAKKLVSTIQQLKQPVLGICVGMQLLCDYSHEGNTEGLGVVHTDVQKFDSSKDIKVPHMGWNRLRIEDDSSNLFNGVLTEDYVYFVHSYYVPLNQNSIASCAYSLEFSAAIKHENFYGIQFHAEKSGKVGERILNNFMNIDL